jgi:hypothetical protein
MADYRIYLLESSGSFRSVHLVTCPNDDDALEIARPLLADCAAVEIWEMARFVAGIPSAPPTAR